MNKYIDVALAKAEFTGNFQNSYPPGQIKAMLDDVPSADVVEVVRCENCKHLVEIDPNNLYVCARIDFGMDGEPNFLSPKTDFCSRGERKEAE